MSPVEIEDYITPNEAAKFFGVTRETFDKWHKNGTGPPRTQIGRRILYRRSGLFEFMRKLEAKPMASKTERAG